MKSRPDVGCWKKNAHPIWVDEERRKNEEENSEVEGVCVCLGVSATMRMCGSGRLWQGDGLPVLCHTFSNQPTVTTWGWRESERERNKEKLPDKGRRE